MSILAYEIIELEEDSNKTIINSKYIICPECKEICKMSIKNYSISIFDYKNGHEIKNLSIDEFEESQKIDLSKIICDKCKKNNKSNTFNNEFFKCFKCNINLCPLCKSSHENNHNIINYEQIYYM